ncbi:MAG: hypothetical protein DRJ03_26255 [Chloroflexi bacterium]|nr:MAG: hypothetical protein DRJ03_26255 [Chloroflexota bacterium]
MAKNAQAPAKKNSAPKAPVLEAPRTLSEEPLYNMATTVRSQFKEVYLVNGKGDRVAVVISTDKKKETKIGSANTDFLCGLVIGAMGGRGDAPGGAAIWVDSERKKMTHLEKYTLVAVPKARGGTLEAPIPVWLDAVSGKAQLLNISVEKHPIPKRVRETTTGSEEEEVEVWL